MNSSVVKVDPLFGLRECVDRRQLTSPFAWFEMLRGGKNASSWPVVNVDPLFAVRETESVSTGVVVVTEDLSCEMEP